MNPGCFPRGLFLLALTVIAAVVLHSRLAAASVEPGAGLIGADDFTAYVSAAVDGQVGGVGFDFDNSTVNDPFVGHSGTLADWDTLSGLPVFADGSLITANASASREFNGPGEGSAPSSDEFAGAVGENSVARIVYLRADMNRQAGAGWSRLSFLEFGEATLSVGVSNTPGPSGGLEFAIERPGVDATYNTASPVLPVAGRTYTLVAKIDYANDLVCLWVDPDLTKAEAANPPYLARAHTATGWSTALGLGSGAVVALPGDAAPATRWDHVVAATEWSALGLFAGSQPDTYAGWIAGYPAVGEARDFSQDADSDGVSNGVEHVLGTDPGTPTQGLREVAVTPGRMVCRHSRRNTLAADVGFSYEWSADLLTWHADGATGEGLKVGTATTVVTPGSPNSEVEVVATITGQADRVFLRIKAVRAAP